MQDLGFNYRLSDLHAALGDSQLKRLDQFISCLLYTSPSPRDRTRYRMPSSA